MRVDKRNRGMEVTVSAKYIEGFTEECMRRGYNAEQTAAALDYALEKQANVFTRAWDRMVGNNDPVAADRTAKLQQSNAAQAAAEKSYNEKLDDEYYNNMYYSDGTRREKPLYSEEELKQRAARSVVTSRMSAPLSRNIGEAKRGIRSIQRQLDATDPSDTGTRASLQRQLQYYQKRAMQYGKQVDTLQKDTFGGYGSSDNMPDTKYGKPFKWYNPATWFAERQKTRAEHMQEVRERNNRMQAEYDAATKAKNRWGMFSVLHPDTWLAPSEDEVKASQAEMDQFNNYANSRKQVMYDMGPEAMAKAQKGIQNIAWKGVTADGYTADKKYRKQLVSQNRQLADMYRNQQPNQ